jgi:hypothetical protein
MNDIQIKIQNADTKIKTHSISIFSNFKSDFWSLNSMFYIYPTSDHLHKDRAYQFHPHLLFPLSLLEIHHSSNKNEKHSYK